MDKKKDLIKRLSEQHPELSRRTIAERIGCTPAYVTQALGPRKPYGPRQKPAETIADPEKVVG